MSYYTCLHQPITVKTIYVTLLGVTYICLEYESDLDPATNSAHLVLRRGFGYDHTTLISKEVYLRNHKSNDKVEINRFSLIWTHSPTI